MASYSWLHKKRIHVRLPKLQVTSTGSIYKLNSLLPRFSIGLLDCVRWDQLVQRSSVRTSTIRLTSRACMNVMNPWRKPQAVYSRKSPLLQSAHSGTY